MQSAICAGKRKPGLDKNWRVIYAGGGQEAEKELECAVQCLA